MKRREMPAPVSPLKSATITSPSSMIRPLCARWWHVAATRAGDAPLHGLPFGKREEYLEMKGRKLAEEAAERKFHQPCDVVLVASGYTLLNVDGEDAGHFYTTWDVTPR